MTITINNIITAVKQLLAVLGKRMTTPEGQKLFSNVTLSSAEQDPILKQYVNSSTHNVEAVLKRFITSTTTTATDITFNFSTTRGDTDFDARVKDMAESYITLNTVSQYLAPIHPDRAKQYFDEATVSMDALVTYVYSKQPPQPLSYSYSDITGTFNAE